MSGLFNIRSIIRDYKSIQTIGTETTEDSCHRIWTIETSSMKTDLSYLNCFKTTSI